MNIEETIIEIILDNCEDIEEDEVTLDASFMDDLQISSLNFFSMISDIEDEFNIKINEQELKRCVTVGDTIKVIEEKA